MNNSGRRGGAEEGLATLGGYGYIQNTTAHFNAGISGEKHGDVLMGDPLPLSIGDQLDREFSSVGAESRADKGVSIGEQPDRVCAMVGPESSAAKEVILSPSDNFSK